MLEIGILGLPNVGKSTLFQALTQKQVDISNYPFCTIEPNVGVVGVPDQRLSLLQKISRAQEIVPAPIKFVDVAGLVKGASKGEGLGNQFLAHLRETDLLVHVVRIFQDPRIVHVNEKVDPLRDIKIVNEELIKKDLESVNKRLEKISKEIKQGKKESIEEQKVLLISQKQLSQGEGLWGLPDKEKEELRHLFLLTVKPQIYVLNGKKRDVSKDLVEFLSNNNFPYIILDVREELDKTQLTEQERKELGLSEPKLGSLIKKCYQSLDLITFFTVVGERQTRAWPLERGRTVFQAAGLVHSDFQKNFTGAEIINWQKLLKVGSWKKAREQGLLQTVSRDHIIEDGDVVEFR